MSTIRPLATITLLVAIGVFLYLKINETEPPMPAELAGWTVPSQLQIGNAPEVDFGSSTGSVPSQSAAPSIGADALSSEAPTFTPNTLRRSVDASGNLAETAAAPSFASAGNSLGVVESPTISKNAPALDVSATSVGEQSIRPDVASSSGRFQADAESGALMPSVLDIPPLPEIPAARVSLSPQSDTALETRPGMLAAGRAPSMNTGTAVARLTLEADTPVVVQSNPTGPVLSAEPAAKHSAPPPQPMLYAATREAVRAAIDRGELSQALLLLSDWYGDPSLTAMESEELKGLLGQLAGSVIYSTQHRLEPPYMVQVGDQLEDIAQKYNVPWQLLAKINGFSRSDPLQPGRELKVIRGPFSALIDLSERKMTLVLQRRYAGQFDIQFDPQITVEEGTWQVDQKLLTPGNTPFGVADAASREERSIVLSNPVAGAGQVAILSGPRTSVSVTTEPPGRVVRLNSADAEDMFDILSVGSRVIIQR